MDQEINEKESTEFCEEIVSSKLVEEQLIKKQKELQRKELIEQDKMSAKLITCLVLFIIPIIGPIIFLSVIKPKDKVIKTLTIISIFGLNILFLFFLLGFYKQSFWEKENF